MRISGVLVKFGTLLVHDIPQLPKPAREVMLAVVLILKCLKEALAFGAGCGSEFGMAATPVTLGHPPYLSSSLLSFLLPLVTAVKYVLTCMYIYI
jgi:hypothetical protein